MRILVVSYMHPSVAPGGAQQVAYETFMAARERGHEAFFIAALEGDHEAEYGKPGAPIVPAPGLEREYFFFPQNYDFVHMSVGDWRSIKFFRELVERLSPDLIHFHHYHRIGVEAIRAARLAAPKATICLTFHEMLAICMSDGQMIRRRSRDLCYASTQIDCHQCFPEFRPEFFELRALRLQAMLSECDAFLFPSEFLSRLYMSWGMPAEKCFVLPNGQMQLSKPGSAVTHSPAVNRFGYFGQFIDNKGIDVILEALLSLVRNDEVPESGIEFVINGGNRHYATESYLARVDEMIATLRDEGKGKIRIRETGRYVREELADRMSAVDWVVAPSIWWEVFGLVVSEAWMFGRPVIVSDIAGLGERVKNGVNGYTFPARNALALAEIIKSLAGNVKEWRRANAAIRPDWDHLAMFDRLLEIAAQLPRAKMLSAASRAVEA
jgi:glycosyltransferase involved in cell wall biosynthesis